MLKFLQYSHSTAKHRFNWYLCTHCTDSVVRRQRTDMGDSCGCLAGNHKHGEEVGAMRNGRNGRAPGFRFQWVSRFRVLRLNGLAEWTQRYGTRLKRLTSSAFN